MARAVTNDEKDIIRKGGQWASLRIAIFKPHEIYSARLASLPSSGDKVAQISFSDGVGTLADVKRDMTLYIGTAAGAYDLGMVRIRKSPISGTFYISEDSKTKWQASAYLTVVDDFDLKARHIRIDGTTPKMDYDISYSSQHTNFLPVPMLGPIVRVVKLVNGTANIQLGSESGLDSWVYGSSISSYLWSVAGATLNDSTIARPVATVTAPGWYLTYCTVTAANGQSREGVRYLYVYDDDNPPAPFIFNSFDEDLDAGGVSFNITLTRQADFDHVRERALCVLFSEDHYGSDLSAYHGSLGPIAGAENIEGIARIAEESIRYDQEKGEVSFGVYGLQEWYKRINAFPAGLELATNTPSAWTSMPALTVDRMLWHLLEYRCTATTIMDIILTGDSRYAKELQSLASSLWAQMEEFAGDTILANLGVDQYGRFICQIEPQLIPEDDRDFPEIMELENVDIIGGVEFEYVTVPDVSLVDLSGVSINISGHANAFFSLAPGHVQNDYGEIRIEDKLLLSSQAQANQLAGLILGWMRNPFKPVSLNIRNNKFLSCFPNQCVVFHIDGSINPRGIDETIRLIPRRRTLEFNKQNGNKSYTIEFEAETFQDLSINGDIPGSEDTSIPPLPAFPELPILPITFPTDVSNTPNGPSVVILVDDTYGILFSKNFSADGPEVLWQFGNGGIDADDVPNIADILITPSGSVWVYCIPSGSGFSPTSGGGIYYASAIGALFQKIIDYQWLVNAYPSSSWDFAGGRFIAGMGYNPTLPEEIAIVAGGNDFGPFISDVNLWIGNRAGFTKRAACTNVNHFYGSLTYGGGKWTLFNEEFTYIGFWNSRIWQFSGDGAGITYQADVDAGGATYIQFHRRVGTSEKFYYWNVFGNFMYYSADNGNHFTHVGDNKQFGDRGAFAVDPTGQYLMGPWDIGQRGFSSDYGYTWTGLPSLPFGGQYAFAYAGGGDTSSRWIAARGVIRYSKNLGNTWENKEGNSGYLIPLGMSIIRILVPGFLN